MPDCCLQKEGANLNDVFQKISKGEYDPLPADRFSAALRDLTDALLSQAPGNRPSAEHVLQQVMAMQTFLQKAGHNPQQATATTGLSTQQVRDAIQQLIISSGCHGSTILTLFDLSNMQGIVPEQCL